MVQGGWFFDYLPNSIGEETLYYTVSDTAGNKATGQITINVTAEKRGGNFGLLLTSLLSSSKTMEGGRLNSLKSFFSSLPIKRFVESGSRAFVYLLFGSIMALFLIYLFELHISNRKILQLAYFGLALSGVYLIKSGLYNISIAAIFIGSCFVLYYWRSSEARLRL